MTPAQQTDLDSTKLKVNAIKVDAFEYLEQISRYEPEMIKASGHKSKEEALIRVIQNTRKDVEKIIVAYERRWPGDLYGCRS